MSALKFLDTNVLAYAYDNGDARKQGIGREFLRRGLQTGEYVISVQILMELSATLLYKFATRISAEQMMRTLDVLAPLRVVEPDRDLVRRGVETAAQYGMHFYDGMIVAAAERAGCKRIWSEDLNAGQEYFGVMVQNPFV